MEMTEKRSTLINDIMKILKVSSITGDMDGIKKCQKVLINIAESMGFKTSLHGNGRVLIIEPAELKLPATIGLVVHIDTVNFDKNQWNYNPLGEISDGKIYGRGIVDDKGPVIMVLHALNCLKNEIEPSWQIIIGSSEESEWIDMQEFLAENPVLPKFSVTIDGDGVQNGCRGCLNLLLKFKRQTSTRTITDFYVPNGMENTVPERAVAIVNSQQIYGFGKEVHSSFPEEGHSAVTNLARIIKASRKSAYNEFKNMFDLLCELDNSCDGMSIGFKDISEFGSYTSVSVTNAFMNFDEITINLNIRLGLGISKREVEEVIKKIALKYDCTFEISRITMSSYLDVNSIEVQKMCEAYEEVIGRKPNVSIAKGLGYNAALPNCAIFGPRFDFQDDDEEDTCHQADEFRSIENIFKFYEILKIFLKKIL